MMKMTRIAHIMASLALGAGMAVSGRALAQGTKPGDTPKAKVDAPEAPKSGSIASIDADYTREVARLERTRLGRLAELATGQAGEEAATTYEAYFRRAIGVGMYDEAEPVAERVLKAGGLPARVAVLAELVNVLAEADRGEYEASIASLSAAVHEADRAGAGPRVPLPVGTRLSLIEAYFQRLVQGDRFDIARKALRLISGRSKEPAIREYVEARLRRLDLIGQPAPPIVGKDLDDKDIRLADDRGDVVLVVFWATWCLPCVEEVGRIERVRAEFRDRGFRVLGVNLDSIQDGGRETAAVLPSVRRFLIENNVPWPNLLNGTDDRDYARAYHVDEIPANVLIGRDGKVVHFDLTRSNLRSIVARAVGH